MRPPGAVPVPVPVDRGSPPVTGPDWGFLEEGPPDTGTDWGLLEEDPPVTGTDWVFVEEDPPVTGPDWVSRPVSCFLKKVARFVPIFFPQISKDDGKRDCKGTGVLCVKRGSVGG